MTTTQNLTNEQAHEQYQTSARALHAHGREHGWPVAPEVWAAYETAERALHSTVVETVGTLTVGDHLYTADGGEMTVVDVNTLVVLLTQDGGSYSSEWHEGESVHQVFVERYRLDGGRDFHGYCDATTRRLTQTG